MIKVDNPSIWLVCFSPKLPFWTFVRPLSFGSAINGIPVDGSDCTLTQVAEVRVDVALSLGKVILLDAPMIEPAYISPAELV